MKVSIPTWVGPIVSLRWAGRFDPAVCKSDLQEGELSYPWFVLVWSVWRKMGHLSNAFESHGAMSGFWIQCQQHRQCLWGVRLAHSVLSKCCDRQGSLRGFACSERCSAFKDTSHLQKRLPAVREQPQSSSDCGQWRAQCSSVVPCLAPHQAAGHWPGTISWWLRRSEWHLSDAVCITLVHEQTTGCGPWSGILFFYS